ncbi:hypothetical protein [Aurantibacter sp.]|uniref:hypothetical protein n=1 Tax=Aurantibacter sp. TaxID=2807103 RepID=UPI003263443C
MVKYVIAFLFSVSTLSAQNSTNQDSNVQVGDVFTIGSAESNSYKHINFPRANFIIKRGGILNYKKIPGSLVEITSVKEKADGTTAVKLKRKNGTRFFGSHKVVEADIYAAVNSGELQAK